MTRINHSKRTERDRMRSRGTESVDGGDLYRSPPKIRPSKAAQRAEMEAALARTITRIHECPGCLKRATVRLLAGQLNNTIRCTSCGTRSRLAAHSSR